MRKIRFGKDITGRWTVTTDGEASPLANRDLQLILTDQFGNKSTIPFTIVDTNVVLFVWYGKDHVRYGTHHLTLFENLGLAGQTAVDEVEFVDLVEYTSQETRPTESDLNMETIDLEGNLTTNGRGANNYELWLIDGHEGTLDDFLEWSKGPKGDPGKDGKSLTFDDLTDEQKEALRGKQGDPGKDGLDAKINGVNILRIVEGANMSIEQQGNTMVFNSTPPGGVVHITGDETIEGRKTFANGVTMPFLEIKDTTSHVKVTAARASSPTDIRVNIEAKTSQGDIDVRLHGIATPTSNTDAVNKQYADTKYVKPEAGIPEADLSEEVKAKLNSGGGAEEVFIAQVNSTSLTEIREAYLEGKLIVAQNGTGFIPLFEYKSVFARFIEVFVDSGTTKVKVLTVEGTEWSSQVMTLASAGDVTALSRQISAKYTKPSSGIPASDLAEDVQESLGKADSALQSVPDTYRTAEQQDTIDAGKASASDLTALSSKIGDLENLETEAKNNLVAAINEAAQSGGGVFVAQYDVTTYNEIKAAHDAGKQVVLEFGGYTFHLTALKSMQANFSLVSSIQQYEADIIRVWVNSFNLWRYDSYQLAYRAEVEQRYTKPSTGIPSTDLAQGVQDNLSQAAAIYQDYIDAQNLL